MHPPGLSAVPVRPAMLMSTCVAALQWTKGMLACSSLPNTAPLSQSLAPSPHGRLGTASVHPTPPAATAALAT